MSGFVALDERVERLGMITQHASVTEDSGLVKLMSITETYRSRIRGALNMLLWSCLTSHFKDKSFILSDDMLRDYEADIVKLPNITPNGLLLPKSENLLAFNLLQKEAIEAFSTLGIGSEIARIQFPINIRVQNGAPDSNIDSRPRASVKPHSDIWAGDPASGILVFLSVLGDPQKAGIDFMMPKTFPLSFVRTLEDYNEGTEIAKDAQTIARFDARGWYFADPYLIHRTTKNSPGYRISLDFRFIPAARTSSDIDEDETRKPWFIPFSDWCGIGTRKMLVTNERMGDFSSHTKKDAYTIGYPVKLSLIDLEPAYDPRLEKAS